MIDKNPNHLNLFEYQHLIQLPEGLNKDNFRSFLDDVWRKYKEEQPEKFWRNNFIEDDEDIKKKQPFLYFDGNQFKPKNYIGFIRYKDFSLNIYPKICQDEYENDTSDNKKKSIKNINQMIYLWLRYSDNIVLPKIETGLEKISDYDFMDFLIYIFAKYTSDLLSVSVYQHYEEISEETTFLKGKLNFSEYIKNCAMGKAHKFHCTYDSFEVNNKFNQIIKYVAKSLLNITNQPDNQNYLSDIIFKLDEVDDVVCTYNDCEKVYINRFMEDFTIVLDYCKLFLKNSITFNNSGDVNNFAFLFRTEVLFEDFISNFTAEKITEYDILAQKESSLDTNGRFHIRPDILIYGKDDKNKPPLKIIDIKYKDAKKNGISQADIYQCVTYAVKLGCSDVTLLYPIFNGYSKDDNTTIQLAQADNTVELKFKFIECCPCDMDNYEIILENNIRQIIEQHTQILYL